MWSNQLDLTPLRGAGPRDESYQRLLNIVLSPGSPIYDLSVPQRSRRNKGLPIPDQPSHSSTTVNQPENGATKSKFSSTNGSVSSAQYMTSNASRHPATDDSRCSPSGSTISSKSDSASSSVTLRNPRVNQRNLVSTRSVQLQVCSGKL